jgi:hypothetical protein
MYQEEYQEELTIGRPYWLDLPDNTAYLVVQFWLQEGQYATYGADMGAIIFYADPLTSMDVQPVVDMIERVGHGKTYNVIVHDGFSIEKPNLTTRKDGVTFTNLVGFMLEAHHQLCGYQMRRALNYGKDYINFPGETLEQTKRTIWEQERRLMHLISQLVEKEKEKEKSGEK